MHKYLVDFNTAEVIKRKAYGKGKNITFKDVIGIKHTVSTIEVNQVLDDATEVIAHKIGQQDCRA